MLEDLALGEETDPSSFAKKDTTIFVIDCCQEIMRPFEGETKCVFESIMECYANFMMSKVIANIRDQVGLILYNIVPLPLSAE
jgi:hypothetical protein